ncbi:MAG TPA: hypothetical protein VF607_01710 [Verrucomicrobiae bacterium]
MGNGFRFLLLLTGALVSILTVNAIRTRHFLVGGKTSRHWELHQAHHPVMFWVAVGIFSLFALAVFYAGFKSRRMSTPP